MSDVIHLWERYPLPTNCKEIQALFWQLSREREPLNPKLLELTRHLNAKFSRADTDELVEPGDDRGSQTNLAFWPEGLPGEEGEDETVCAVYNLAMGPDSHLVFPFLMTTACSLGLTVYCSDSGEAYLPDGRLVSAQGSRRWDGQQEEATGAADRLDSIRQAGTILTQELRPFLQPQGFKQIKNALAQYRKPYPEITHAIGFHISANYCLSVSSFVTPHFGKEYTQSYWLDLIRLVEKSGQSLPGTPKTPRSCEIKLTGITHLKTVAQNMGEFLVGTVLPALQTCVSLRELDAQVNRTPREQCVFERHDYSVETDLTIAYLAKNPNFDGLAARQLGRTPPSPHKEHLIALIAEWKAQG